MSAWRTLEGPEQAVPSKPEDAEVLGHVHVVGLVEDAEALKPGESSEPVIAHVEGVVDVAMGPAENDEEPEHDQVDPPVDAQEDAEDPEDDGPGERDERREGQPAAREP